MLFYQEGTSFECAHQSCLAEHSSVGLLSQLHQELAQGYLQRIQIINILTR